MSIRAETVTELARLEQLAPQWDELAVSASLPYCAPGWLLPWWGEAAPAGARLHAVACLDGERLVALAPLVLRGSELLPLGVGATTRVEPIAERGREREAAEAIARSLAPARVLRLPGVPESSPWPELLAEATGAWLHEEERMPAPVVELEDTFDAWLATRSSRMRNHLRRYARLLDEREARVELAARDGAVHDFAELHRARWAGRGGSGVLDANVERAVAGSAGRLPPERFRLYTVAAGGRAVAASLFVAAGGESSSWLGGFDERWRDISPQLLLGVEAIRDAYARGERRVDFGAGASEYKQRLATSEETLRWMAIVIPGPGQLRIRAGLLQGRLRLALSQRLSNEQKRRMKKLLRRPA
jgi:CelD/BcsL family acetyltransferase involved in cellulose biosynthesis